MKKRFKTVLPSYLYANMNDDISMTETFEAEITAQQKRLDKNDCTTEKFRQKLLHNRKV